MARSRTFKPSVILVIIALPLGSLLAGVTMLSLFGNDGLDRVAGPVQRIARMQQIDLSADYQAARLGLAGHLQVEGDSTRFELATGEAASLPATLLLQLEHPIESRSDRQIMLERGAAGWQAAGFDPRIGWHVSIVPPDGSWRLVGRWVRDAPGIPLLPAMAGDGGEPDGPG